MNYFKAIQIGFAVISALAQLNAGQATAPFKIKDSWYEIQEVPGPDGRPTPFSRPTPFKQ